jgi:hypothetical protein
MTRVGHILATGVQPSGGVREAIRALSVSEQLGWVEEFDRMDDRSLVQLP